MALPPGQHARTDFPRFGLSQFANRAPALPKLPAIEIAGEITNPQLLDTQLSTLPTVRAVTDFHCVTTWSSQGLQWQGWRFTDVYTQLVRPNNSLKVEAAFALLMCLDGYRTTLPLTDLLSPDVLLATHLNGAPLERTHGAPLRLVAPAHYGYKNVKHLCRVEIWQDAAKAQSPGFRFMDHPRARVEYEERGRGLPGIIYRWLYRPLINATVKQFAKLPALDRD